MVKRLIIIAFFAGLATGATSTIFQMIYAVPLILEAEEFEAVGEAAGKVETHTATGPTGHAVAQNHSHGGEDEWAPASELERSVSTLGANLFAGIGFSLLLVAAFHLRGDRTNAQTGLLWGGAGFVSFSLAPLFGLPPELPGMAAADLTSRQIWWVGTVVSTSGGLALLAFPSALKIATPLRILVGLLLLIAPFAIGAPEIATEAEVSSSVPAHLSAEFAIVALTHGLIFWLLMGAMSGWLYGKWFVPAENHSGGTRPVRQK
ncbi:cobalt transporter [Maritimibacter sp. 55A14]|uniref:CbtA family protein n=1 Tax=Maritimibacter sp. 55A14 TaxID=2174844 RepID=UPI000D60E5A1|nr:CbtA family protein [Maritimibacter sp. 55A14]PWE28830.1 cobalt transporter [Maritimibacter sp. 55A14]